MLTMVQTRLKVGGFEAWVVVEKKKVEHYDVDVDEESNVATAWVASTAGKEFGVWVVKRHSRFDSVFDLYLDGSWVTGGFLLKDEKSEPSLMNKVSVGESSVRRFLFGALNVTDDESVLSTQSHEELGTIKLIICRITNYKFRLRDLGPKRSRYAKLQENVKIHERAKKSTTHQISFGETKTVSKKRTKNVGYPTYTEKEVIATFIFHYRSLDMLKALEIAPCDPSPEVPSKPRPVSKKRKAAPTEEEEEKPVVGISDTEDEEVKRKDEEDQRKEAELEAEIEKLRQGRLERKHASKRVKCEPKPVFLPGEIIDLTI